MRWMWLALVGIGCGNKPCEPEPFEGTMFITSSASEFSVAGSVRWPASIPEGLRVQFGLEWADGTGELGAISDSGLLDSNYTCGTGTTFKMKGITPDEYRVKVTLHDDSEDGDSGDYAIFAEGLSDAIVIDQNVTGVVVNIDG